MASPAIPVSGLHQHRGLLTITRHLPQMNERNIENPEIAMNIPAAELTRFSTQILTNGGATADVANKVARRLVTANLKGHDSHGVGMIPRYVEGIRINELDPAASAEIVQDHGPFMLIDGKRGFGQIIAEQAMEHAIDRARDQKFALMSLRNSFHIGRVGDWGEMAASAGFISIHYVNVLSPSAHVAPFGGSDARFSTNPYCTAIPATANTPMTVLDMATSNIAHGKARVAYLSGKQAPENSLIDATGAPTTNPAVLFEEPLGALSTFGLHKGFGLAMLGDLLGGSLSGGGAFLPDRIKEGRIINNMLTILIDPDVFGGADAFFSDVDAYTNWVKASPPAPGVDGVMVPGDPERLATEQRERDGIPLDTGTWAQLVETATSVGMTPEDIGAFTNF